MKYKGKAVGIIMADAIFKEDCAAHAGKRDPKTSRAIANFQASTDNTIPYETVVQIFDVVFPAYLEVRKKHVK